MGQNVQPKDCWRVQREAAKIQGMATKHSLKAWVLTAVDDLGPSGVLQVSRWIWEHHEAELRASRDLFYTWQYDVRWAAQELRNAGVLAPVARGSAARWQPR